MLNTPELQNFVNDILFRIKHMHKILKEAKRDHNKNVLAWDTREVISRRTIKLRQMIATASHFKRHTGLKMFRKPYKGDNYEKV